MNSSQNSNSSAGNRGESQRSAGGGTAGLLTHQGGYQKDGTWFCACAEPASHLLVKKDGKNKGRWFYRCPQREKKKECKFWLWQEEAEQKEQEFNGRPVITGTIGSHESPLPSLTPRRPQPGRPIFTGIARTPNMGSSRMPRVEDAPADRYSDSEDGLFVADSTARNKRKRSEGTGTGTISSLGTDVWDEVVKREVDLQDFGSPHGPRHSQNSAPSLSQSFSPGPSQDSNAPAFSHGSSIEHRPPFTPTANRTVHGLPTPVTRRTLLLASEEREAKRRRGSTVMDGGFGGSSAFGETDDAEATQYVMDMLGTQRVDDDVRQNIRAYLNSSLITLELQKHGVETARNMLRTQLAAKDQKISELQERIAALENDKAASRERWKNKLKALSQEDDD